MKMKNGMVACDECGVLVFERNIQWQELNDRWICLSCADNASYSDLTDSGHIESINQILGVQL